MKAPLKIIKGPKVAPTIIIDTKGVAEALDDCIAYIEAKGWCKGKTRTTGGKVCILGAAWDVILEGYTKAQKPMLVYQNTLAAISRYTLVRYKKGIEKTNDTELKNKKEAIDLLLEVKKRV